MIKINSLTLVNFKSYETRQTLKFGDLNLFFGDNGAGKSTILDALNYVLNLLKYGDQHYPFWGINRDTVFGGFSRLVSNQKLDE